MLEWNERLKKAHLSDILSVSTKLLNIFDNEWILMVKQIELAWTNDQKKKKTNSMVFSFAIYWSHAVHSRGLKISHGNVVFCEMVVRTNGYRENNGIAIQLVFTLKYLLHTYSFCGISNSIYIIIVMCGFLLLVCM